MTMRMFDTQAQALERARIMTIAEPRVRPLVYGRRTARGGWIYAVTATGDGAAYVRRVPPAKR